MTAPLTCARCGVADEKVYGVTLDHNVHLTQSNCLESLLRQRDALRAEVEKLRGGPDDQWPSTMDGMEWATQFHARFPTVSVDDALGWFCNAIMAGYDEAQRRAEAEVAALKADAGTITDAMVEAGARAYHEEKFFAPKWPSWDSESRDYREITMSRARIYITAALAARAEGK